MMILICGGSCSGKSKEAEKIVKNFNIKPFYYIATMKNIDSECNLKIKRHRKMREGKDFITYEMTDISKVNFENFNGGTALLEDVSNLLSNEMFFNNSKNCDDNITNFITKLYMKLNNLIIVSNNIFEDVPNKNDTIDEYCKKLGKINCNLADISEIVIELSSGIPIFWKGKELKNEVGI